MTELLGKYAVEVIGAYAVALGLLAAVTWLSLHQARKAAAGLKQAEDDNG